MVINRETEEEADVQTGTLCFMAAVPNLESFERYHSGSGGFGFVLVYLVPKATLFSFLV
jgi:hypothetical protein